ncbi:uncharacterized protein LOC106011656 [Aplysia californica]|uniref:Uncharacterized protein LOC106011656 n=1 Tax=Aplysia californica TaxID=6500 RepID=A0ABM0ZZ51_APLCA|nr:uncharacterized protein LOC106011656 [Aplysia californica]
MAPPISTAALITVGVLLSVLTMTGAQRTLCSDGARFEYNFKDCQKFYICVGPNPHSLTCPDELVFSIPKKRCVYRDSDDASECLSQEIGQGGAASLADQDNMADEASNLFKVPELEIPVPKNIIAMDQRCLKTGAPLVAHERYCHRYFNCSQPHPEDMNK